MVLGSGAEAVRVKHWRAHTWGDSIVYLPDSGVLVTGDVLDDLPFGGHGYPSSWVAALEELGTYRQQLAGDDPIAGRAWDNFMPPTIERAWLEARGELPD